MKGIEVYLLETIHCPQWPRELKSVGALLTTFAIWAVFFQIACQVNIIKKSQYNIRISVPVILKKISTKFKGKRRYNVNSNANYKREKD